MMMDKPVRRIVEEEYDPAGKLIRRRIVEEYQQEMEGTSDNPGKLIRPFWVGPLWVGDPPRSIKPDPWGWEVTC